MSKSFATKMDSELTLPSDFNLTSPYVCPETENSSLQKTPRAGTSVKLVTKFEYINQESTFYGQIEPPKLKKKLVGQQ
jgi:hypothetical protein